MDRDAKEKQWIETIVADAEESVAGLDGKRPLQQYLTTAATMLSRVRSLEETAKNRRIDPEAADQQTIYRFKLLYKYVCLYTNVVRKHASAKSPAHSADVAEMKLIAFRMMDTLEEMKTKELKSIWTRWYERALERKKLLLQQQQQQQVAQEAVPISETSASAPVAESASLQPANATNPLSYMTMIQHENSTVNAAPPVARHPSSNMVNQVPALSPPSNSPASDWGPSLRRVLLEQHCLQVFMQYAAGHTARDIEFCGLLCGCQGTDGYGEFLQVTHLVIPEQQGQKDTCVTMNEDDVMEFAIAQQVMVLGWIHTHPAPNMGAFLSSIDQHCQLGHQLMLPESIAVVMAPKSVPNMGIFHLVQPDGIQTVRNCKQTGFHKHAGPETFVHCRHVQIIPGRQSTVVADLRRTNK
jgi:proteasome lid subunit RPN8/RPN11